MQGAVAVESELHELLCGAIEAKRFVRFRYKGEERIVEPHDYGIQKGIARLLSWQVGGESGGRLPGWRWFDIGDMGEFEVLDKMFPGNREVSGEHHRWDQVFIRVKPPEKR